MTITRADLAIFKPELTGNSDLAGGQRTGTKLVSGKLNDLFTPISDIDHAQSAFHIAKCFPALDTTGTETLLGAHIFVNQPPVDTLVSVTVAETPLLTDEARKPEMIAALESGVTAGPIVSATLPSGTIGLAQYTTSFDKSYWLQSGVSMRIGDVITIGTEYTGTASEAWPAFQHFCEIVDIDGDNYYFSPALPYAAPSGNTTINGQTSCTKIRTTVVDANAVKFRGVTKLTAIAAAAATALTVTNTASQVIPLISDTVEVTNIAVATGGNTTLSFTLAVKSPILDTLNIKVMIGTVLHTASSNGSGVITSTPSGITGNITGDQVSLTFATAPTGNLTYSVTGVTKTTPAPEQYGVNPLKLQNKGAVDIFRNLDVVAIQHSQFQTVASPAAGQTKTIRTNARFADITDATGASLWTPTNTHFSVDLVAGTVTINSSFPGFTAPFTLTDTIGELGLVKTKTATGITLVSGVTREYPVGTTVASVQALGDLQATHGDVFDMTSWAGDWDATGSPASGDLNNEAYPIELNNRGCINEDWAIIFTSSTAFRLVGKGVGQVAIGDIMNDFIPMNLLVSQPYFIIRQEAFGTGWNAGEVIRFRTYAAAKPLMLLRTVESGHSAITTDRTLISFRGNEA